jgi:molybdate-binding protein/DNA-binding XRE family transcriptional regulator
MLKNNLKQFRLRAGLSQQALAGKAGISRQAYLAIESGKSSPSTEVALRLALALGNQVDGLFSLAGEPPEYTWAELVGNSREESLDEDSTTGSTATPKRVRLWRVGDRLLARQVIGQTAARHSLADAEGVLLPLGLTSTSEDNRVSVQPFDGDDLASPTVSLLGCDPAMALLEAGLGKHGVRLISSEENSYRALTGLALGEAHVAGCHLRDEDTGDYNLSWVRRLVPFPCVLVTFASWQQGLIVMPGNPKNIFGVADLARPEVRMVNREPGSGSRSLLDRLLASQGIPALALDGYHSEAPGHLAVASAVSTGLADVGVGVQAAASSLGLGFVTLEEERYDLVFPKHLIDEPGVQALLDLLRSPGLHRRVEALGGYDVSNMGRPAA